MSDQAQFDYLSKPADEVASTLTKTWMFQVHQLAFTLTTNPDLVHPSLRKPLCNLMELSVRILKQLEEKENNDGSKNVASSSIT